MTSGILHLVLNSGKIAAAPSWTNQFRTQISMETWYLTSALQTTGRDLTSRTPIWVRYQIAHIDLAVDQPWRHFKKVGERNGNSSARFLRVLIPGSGWKALIPLKLSMADRRSYQYSNMHWTNTSTPYSPTANYSPAEYQGTVPSASTQSMGQAYSEDTYSQAGDEGYSSSYYSNSYNHTNPLTTGYHTYSSMPSQASNDSTTLHGQRHTHHPSLHQPQSTHPYPSTLQSYAYPHYSSLEGQSRGRSYSQTQDAYISQPPSPTSYQASAQYPTQIPLTPAPTIQSQYPTSPSRPFSCDLCTLSFNRQHDLKRHRETHSGEKPYFCNGGCGKTFTRKDALKRHQVGELRMVRTVADIFLKLVKGCGKPEEPWSS